MKRRNPSLNSSLRLASRGVALAFIFILAGMSLQPAFAQNNGAAASVESRRQQLLSLFDEEWEYQLRTNPEWASRTAPYRSTSWTQK
jgi:hypothetical protein